MAKYSNTIEYNINTKLDSSGLVKLQAQIKQLENSMQQMSNRELLNSDKVQQAKAQLEGLNTALTNSFNSSLGILDLSKFRAELDSSGVSAVGLRSAFNMMGAEGQAALNGLTTQIANFNGGMERTSSAVDKIATTFGNTFRWGVIASFFSQFMNAIHSSIDYVKELDDSLTQIRLVTDYNRDSMNAYAKAANEAAKAVGQTTVGMTNASLIFAQQGYDLSQSQELATLSAKLANASQQDTATTSDQITAYMNAYGLSSSIEDLSSALDSWALVANVSAADVAELATASQKAASTANSVGVNMDQLNAQIATIESVTRDAPEQIGNGLKTLYARFSDIKLGKTLEDGVNLGQVTGQLNKLGIQVLDQFGNIRDVGDILEDLMVIWDDLDQTTKEASAQTLAGKFQMNRFLALMDNSDMYREYLGASENAEGTLDQMNAEYLDSLEGRTAKIQASLEGIFSSIFDTDVVYPFIDAMQKFLDILQTLIDSLGGGSTIVLGLVSAFGQLFSQNIARGINDTLANRELMQIRQRNIEGVNDTLDRVGIDRNSGIGQYISNTAAQAKQGAINDVQYDTYMNNVQNWINASTALAKSEENLTDNINLTNAVFEKITGVSQAITRDETGLNALAARQVSLNDEKVQSNLRSADFSEEAEKARQVALALREVQIETQKTKISDKELGTAIQLVGDRFADLGYAFDVNRAEQIQFRLEAIRKEIDDSGEVSVDARKEIQGYVTELEHLNENLMNLDSNSARKVIADAGRSAEKAETDVAFNQTQVNRAEADANDSKANVDNQQQIEQIIDAISAVGQLAFAWQAFQNLGSLWANEDLTTGEKVLQTVMNLTMTMPQLILAMQTLEKTKAFDGIGNLFSAISDLGGIANDIQGIQKLLEMEEKGVAAYDEMIRAVDQGEKIADGLEDVWKAGEQATKILSSMDDGLVQLAKSGDAAGTELTGIAKIFAEGMATALAEGATGAGLFAGGLKAVGAAAAEALPPLLPYLAIGAAIAGIAFLIGEQVEEAKKAKEEALEAFNEAQSGLEQLSSIQEKINSFNDSYNNDNKSNKELVNQANEIALAMKEAGLESEAMAVHLATVRAESLGTEAAFADLNNTISESQKTMEETANKNVIDTSSEVLRTQNVSLEEIIENEQKLKETQEELANLNPFDEDYESEKQRLEDLIEKYKEAVTWSEEATEAAHAMIDAQGNIVGSNLALTSGHEMRALGTRSEDARAATMDFYSLQEEFSKNVSGFDQLDELEQMDFMLQHVQDDAQKAAIQVEQLLYANENLTANDRQYLTAQMEQAGLSADQTLKFVASLDENATREEIQNKLIEITQSGEPFEIALQATMDPEQVRDMVRSQLAAYEPTDEDVNSEDFQTMANMFMANEENMGKEGTPFEDYSADLLENADALEEVVESTLRYNDAIESLNKNLDDWKEALSDTNEFSLDHIHAVQELQETYADFLDLSEDFNVSEEFAESADNLKLMEDAANGVEGAYEDLAQAAAKDILDHSDVENIEAAEDAFSGLVGYLNGDAFAALNVGDAIDLSSIKDQINDLAEATGWTADQMSAYLASVGINVPPDMFEPIAASAEDTLNHVEGVVEGVTDTMLDNADYSVSTDIESDTATENDEVVYTNLIPRATAPVPITSTFPVGNAASYGSIGAASAAGFTSQEATAWVSGVEYTADPVTTTEVKEMTGYKSTTKAEKGGTGAVNIKSGAKGTKGTGGAKRGRGGRPSGGGGGGHRGGGGGKGGKGKGGKGSSPKAIKPKEKKEHEKDYYEEVNSQLDKTEKVLSRIEKEEDRLIGDKARANQNKQLALLQKEIKLNEEKLKINKQELKDTDEKLKQQDKLAEQILRQQGIQMVIPNPVFDKDGVIANYEQISKALDDAHNELVKKYNAAAEAGNQELTEQLQEQMDSFDKYSKSLLDSAKRHNALQSEIEETTNALEELKNTIEDIQIAAYKASQEALDDLIELKKDAAEFQKTFRDFDPNSFINSWSIDDTPYGDLIEQLNILENVYGGAEETAREFYDTLIEQKKKELAATKDKDERDAIQSTIDFYNEQKSQILPGQNVENSMLGLAMKDLERLKGWMNGTNTESNPFGKNAAALKDAYKDAYERVKKLQEDFDKTVEAARDARIKLMEQQADEVDYVIDGYDRVLDRLEKVSDTYTLYYGEDSYNDILKIMQQQGDIMQIQLNQSRIEYDRLLEQYQEALENGDKATIKAAKDLLDKAEDRMLDNAKELADHWVKVYEKSIDASLQKMTDTIWGKTTATVNPDGTLSNIRLGLEDLQTQWELEKQYMEDYKDEFEKAYEIDKLRGKYLDLLNDAQGASLGTQNKIRQQMKEQLDSLGKQTTLSEYDVKLANAKLEVLQKQIALEDAQRNKNKMQLRRDTQGNYRYVYRADEGDVKQAQDELLDSSFDAYELTKNQAITNSDRAVQLYQDMLEKMSEASKKYQDDQVAREAALQKIAEQYSKMFKALGEDFDDVTKGMYEVLCWNVENSTNETSTAAMDLLDALYDKNGQVKEDTGIMYWDLANTIKTDVLGEIDKEANNTILDIDIAAKALESNLTSSMDIIGSNIGELNDTLSVTINRANDLKEANDNLFDAFKGDSADIKTANAELAKYQKQLEDTQNSASSLAQQLKAANQQIATLTAENLNYRTRNTTPGTSRTTNPNGNTPSSPNRGTNPSRGTNPGGGTPSTGNPGGTPNRGNPGGGTPNGGNPGGTNDYYDRIAKAIKKKGSKWATGGYTGTWNGSGDPETGDGKLIWVHQKELILNAKDTENILDAVNLMRDMVSIIQIDALGKTLKSNINNADKSFGDTIEQRVEINATFPNVTNSNEIETALLGLSDKAYQYSYRTR